MEARDIAFLLGYPEISGGTNVILEHALGLTRLGHTVSIVTELPFDPRRLCWKPAAMKLPLLCHAQCRDRLFDVTFATWWRSVFDLPFVPARRYAYFCQSIESRFFSAQDPDMKALVDYTYRQPLEIVTEASWIARYLRDNYRRDACLVRNGIDKSIFRPDGDVLAPRPDDHIRVLVEGPLGVAFKQVELTIELCQRAGMRDLWLLTSSDCQAYPGVNRVLSKVPMGEVGAVYRSCDVLVKLSTVEGMFGPPLEMMHCGGTAITSDVTGHDEYMQHGDNGLVVCMGQETEVLGYLRALDRDRAFLNRLKEGAKRTQQAWPDWPQAVLKMEQFITSIVAQEGTRPLADRCMLESLTAALRLAGPLHAAMFRERSGRELVRELARKVRTKLVRKLPWRGEPRPRPPSQAQPLPPLQDGRLIGPAATYRICFLGDARRHRAHVPGCSKSIASAFVDIGADGEITARAVDVIRTFNPDFTFVFAPERLTPQQLNVIPGMVIGHATQPASPQTIDRFRRLFPAGESARAALLHTSTREALKMMEAGINCPGTFLRPVDTGLFSADQGFDKWSTRPIALLVTGPLAPAWSSLKKRLASVPGFVHIADWSDERALAPILARARMTLHLSVPGGLPDSAKMVRDMAGGCLVVSDSPQADYGLLPGEHYLFAGLPEDIAAAIDRQNALPDSLDVIRQTGGRRARSFDANSAYARMIEQLFNGKGQGG